MRRDGWTVRTWILATVAGWAVLVVALALFGLGGRIVPLGDDPSLVQPLPALLPALPERLGSLTDYKDVAERTLFSEDRRPKPFFISGEQTVAPSFDLFLSSVLLTPTLQLAIVQSAQGGEGMRVKLGQAPAGFPGWRLTELSGRRAVFEGAEGRRELQLRVYDGSGGEQDHTGGKPRVTGRLTGLGQQANTKGHASQPMMGSDARHVTPPLPAPSFGQAAFSSPSPALPSGSQPTASTESPAAPHDMDAIRQRIEQRRAQLRQQQATPHPLPATSGKSQ